MSHVTCHMSGVTCQVSGVRCQVSGVRCPVSDVRCKFFLVKKREDKKKFKFDKVVELVNGGSVINRATH